MLVCVSHHIDEHQHRYEFNYQSDANSWTRFSCHHVFISFTFIDDFMQSIKKPVDVEAGLVHVLKPATRG